LFSLSDATRAAVSLCCYPSRWPALCSRNPPQSQLRIARPVLLAACVSYRMKQHDEWTYWMARGYGLFAANPLGQKAFSTEKKEPVVRELKFTLERKQSAVFRYRVLVLSLSATLDQVGIRYRHFTSEVK
jgi:hypothetical protein